MIYLRIKRQLCKPTPKKTSKFLIPAPCMAHTFAYIVLMVFIWLQRCCISLCLISMCASVLMSWLNWHMYFIKRNDPVTLLSSFFRSADLFYRRRPETGSETRQASTINNCSAGRSGVIRRFFIGRRCARTLERVARTGHTHLIGMWSHRFVSQTASLLTRTHWNELELNLHEKIQEGCVSWDIITHSYFWMLRAHPW